ncbi:MAG: glutamate 5-kinase [Pseudomonadota bacterium]
MTTDSAPPPDAPTPGAVIAGARRLIVKVGSALLIDAEGALRRDWMAALAGDLSDARARGAAVAIVSSGAVGLGAASLGLRPPLRLEEKQAAAACGQPLLMAAWAHAFAAQDARVAQVLLTLSDADDRRRYLNARATLATLLDLGVVAVVNENDTTATTEIRYGDNDRLAAHAAQMIGADALILLTDVDGLYDRDPRADPAARHVPYLARVDAAARAMAGGPNAARGAGSGGMRTKLDAAAIAGAAGCATIVAAGTAAAPLAALHDGARATVIAAGGTPDGARRAWIAGRLNPAGVVRVDAGAARAVRGGASLLPAGVTAVEGAFAKGDAVRVVDPDGDGVGQGLVAYDAADADAIKGLRTEDAEAALGYRRAALIHRDDLVLFD